MGISYYIKPKLDRLLNMELWSAACSQILFSLSPCTGAATALASFNARDYGSLLSDSILIAAANSGFSLFSGVVVFAVVGNLAHTTGESVEEVLLLCVISCNAEAE